MLTDVHIQISLSLFIYIKRTYNAANEILEHEEKANDHAASACLVSPGDFPPGGHPSARTRNKVCQHILLFLKIKCSIPFLLCISLFTYFFIFPHQSMATHLFILAEKLAADPNLLHSNAKSGARLIQSLAALRLVSEE